MGGVVGEGNESKGLFIISEEGAQEKKIEDLEILCKALKTNFKQM